MQEEERLDKKVLIVSYYWPPSGGAGVQRWLKLSKFLTEQGVKCNVITVDPEKSSYPTFDASLEEEVHKDITVYKTSSFEITNWYKSLAGKKNTPTAGFSNVDNKNWKQKLVNSIRSNFFIPDPRIGWNKYAYRKAAEVIQKEKINTVITTSPPHSTQMVGLKLKKRGLVNNWIVDFRDPWTDIYYYPLLQHSALSHLINKKKEKAVIEAADKILTVSSGLIEGFRSKTATNIEEKFIELPNGYDPDDFVGLAKDKNEEFTIVYTGTMSDIYEPQLFFEVLDQIFFEQILPYQIKIIGSFSQKIKDQISKLNLKVQYIDTVPHSEINKYQMQADLLLLVIPNTEQSKGILTGKLFEYLATENTIINLGPADGDAAEIISTCESGQTFERTEKEQMKMFILNEISKFRNKISSPRKREEILKYSREKQSELIMNLIL